MLDELDLLEHRMDLLVRAFTNPSSTVRVPPNKSPSAPLVMSDNGHSGLRGGMAYTTDLKSVARKGLWVRVPSQLVPNGQT